MSRGWRKRASSDDDRFSLSPLWERVGVRGGATQYITASVPRTPHPNPLPQGERENLSSSYLLALGLPFALALTFAFGRHHERTRPIEKKVAVIGVGNTRYG
jgi:hypothetical protein